MRTRHALLIALLPLWLAGCAGKPPQAADIAYRDLGEVGEGASNRVTAPLPAGVRAALEVRAASWLDSPAQQYRLLYADPSRRHAYTSSRWAAAPADLLGRHLQRQIGFDAGASCRVSLAIDELVQRFASPGASDVVLDVRATLLSGRGGEALAHRAWRFIEAAPAADARGGVSATRDAADALAQSLMRWLDELVRQHPELTTRCKDKP